MTITKFLLETSIITGFPIEDLYCIQNGKKITSESEIVDDIPLRWAVRLVGGKGGFGSMLRAIGAQIEKTTNREACRDLSGRRLRDIREEQRLREWASNQTQRDEEARHRREEKLKKLTEKPKFEFNDKVYDETRKNLENSVDEAVEKGFQADPLSIKKPAQKRKAAKLWIDDDLSGVSDSDSENDGSNCDKSEESDSPPEKQPKLEETPCCSKSLVTA